MTPTGPDITVAAGPSATPQQVPRPARPRTSPPTRRCGALSFVWPASLSSP